jgi:hypothetical protein
MKTALALVAVAAILLAFSLPAMAQDQPPDEAVTIYDKWEDELVPGDLVRGTGTLVGGAVNKKTSGSLVTVRTHFIPELLKSVHKL